MTDSKKKMRCSDTLSLLVKGGEAVFFTLTTADEVDFAEIRRRWRVLRHDLVQDIRRRRGKPPLYVMNFERHPGYLQKVVKDSKTVERVIRSDGRPHGWHIHGVIDTFVPIRRYRAMLTRSGFGRVDVRRVKSKGVADYLTKHALKAYRGLSRLARARLECQRMRLVNVSRGLPALSAYKWQSGYLEGVRYLMNLQTMELRHLGKKIDNALVYWKRAEVAHMLRGTPFYEDLSNLSAATAPRSLRERYSALLHQKPESFSSRSGLKGVFGGGEQASGVISCRARLHQSQFLIVSNTSAPSISASLQNVRTSEPFGTSLDVQTSGNAKGARSVDNC